MVSDEDPSRGRPASELAAENTETGAHSCQFARQHRPGTELAAESVETGAHSCQFAPVDAEAGAAGAVGRRREASVAGHGGDAAKARSYLHDDDPMVRSSALRALERAGDLAARELEAALTDPAPAVRLTALELATVRGDIAAAAAARLLVDGDHRVVEAAAWACGEKVAASDNATAGRTDACGSGTAAVVDALAQVARSHDDPLCRESAIAALGAISDPAGLPAILAGLDDKPEVRRRAVIALAPFDGPEVDAALLRAATDRDRQVRTAAAELRDA